MPVLEGLQRLVSRFRHAQLLAMLALLLLSHPYVEGNFAEVGMNLLLLLTLASAVLACAVKRSQLVVGLVLMMLLQVAAWYRILSDIDSVTVLYSVLSLGFFGFVIILVLGDVFRARVVSKDTIAGALAAYLLIGLWWAFAYALLETLVPGSIVGLRGGGTPGGYDQFLGYSFITLTTLGYGNVVPGNVEADTLASAEAVVGQLYLTVLVARLVALNLTADRNADE